jgi:16S rRNA (cytosine1402-N4)-methyltransferase
MKMEDVPDIQHRPVMEQTVLELLLHDTPAVYVDCTLGGGGHARAFLRAAKEGSVLLGVDRDLACVTAAQIWGAPWATRFHPVHGNFRCLSTLLSTFGYPRVDSILFDLGVSSYQLETASRGFSFHLDGPLDMRMDTTQLVTAASLVNHTPLDELRHILQQFGEERWAARIARAIVAERATAPIMNTHRLAEVVANAIPRAAWPPNIHPATRVFQAFRIAVNDELQTLREALPQAVQALCPGGRLGVIAFHSLEDRQVKQFLFQEVRGCICPPRWPQCMCGRQPRLKLLARKPLRPTLQEMQDNPRSRSARLRVAEKLDVEE